MALPLKAKVVLMRAVRAFVTGAASTAVTVSGLVAVNNIQSFKSLGAVLAVVALSVIVGGINGLLAGADKLIRWTDEVPTPSSQ